MTAQKMPTKSLYLKCKTECSSPWTSWKVTVASASVSNVLDATGVGEKK